MLSTRCMRNIRFAPGGLLLVFGAISGFGQPAAPSPYAGSEACGVCHEDIYKAFAKNPHDVVETDAKSGWKGHGFKGQACEACHGPGKSILNQLPPPTFGIPRT